MSDNKLNSKHISYPSGPIIGHVHLKVSDLERSLKFYTDVINMVITQRMGKEAAFLSYDGYHHHLGLNVWESLGGSPPIGSSTGLYHFAILYPTRSKLAEAVKRVIRYGIMIDGAADHGVSEAIYLKDPDKNGIELYWDKPIEKWPMAADGSLQMYTKRLDIDGLLEASDG